MRAAAQPQRRPARPVAWAQAMLNMNPLLGGQPPPRPIVDPAPQQLPQLQPGAGRAAVVTALLERHLRDREPIVDELFIEVAQLYAAGEVPADLVTRVHAWREQSRRRVR